MFSNQMTEPFRRPTDFKIKRSNTIERALKGGLKIYCLNINSLLKHSDELRIMADENNICLNETKLDGNIGDEELVIDGFHNIIRKNQTRHGGGVAIYVNKTSILRNVLTYSLSPGVWQSFVTIRSCNHLMRIIPTYVDNTKKSEIS